MSGNFFFVSSDLSIDNLFSSVVGLSKIQINSQSKLCQGGGLKTESVVKDLYRPDNLLVKNCQTYMPCD